MAIIERMKLTISHDGAKKIPKSGQIGNISNCHDASPIGSRMGQGRVQLCRSICGAQEDKGKDYF